MIGKGYSTEDKIRMLREADAGRTIIELCWEKNIAEATFHRWKREFGVMEVDEAKRLKELETENTELKKMPADSLLENRVLRYVNEKNYEPRGTRSRGPKPSSPTVCAPGGPRAGSCTYPGPASGIRPDGGMIARPS